MKDSIDILRNNSFGDNKFSQAEEQLKKLTARGYRLKKAVMLPRQHETEPQGIIILQHQTGRLYSALVWIRNDVFLIGEPVRFYA